MLKAEFREKEFELHLKENILRFILEVEKTWTFLVRANHWQTIQFASLFQ